MEVIVRAIVEESEMQFKEIQNSYIWNGNVDKFCYDETANKLLDELSKKYMYVRVTGIEINFGMNEFWKKGKK